MRDNSRADRMFDVRRRRRRRLGSLTATRFATGRDWSLEDRGYCCRSSYSGGLAEREGNTPGLYSEELYISLQSAQLAPGQHQIRLLANYTEIGMKEFSPENKKKYSKCFLYLNYVFMI